MISPRRILLTGASGYVGGRLLTRLLGEGQAVRCLARAPGALSRRVGAGIEVVRGDLLDPGSLGSAFEGIDTAFYLVHSMGSGAGYAELDRRAAEVFGAAARRAGVRRIVYLGGLADPGAPLSRHLRSRLATGDHLRASGVPVTEFRASIVIGSGSLSFEMIRSLVERLPLMVWPRWVRTEAQPIGIDDLVTYLAAALDLPDDGANRVFEIGGADTASYGDLMREYARQRGLRRLMVPVPFLTPKISSLWLGLVTPVYARVGRELIDGVRNASVVGDR
ncbi:MAG: NAD(P)H-binding protein, partial [Acidobacteria bacterium]|nr:NAD(P)H-binding protein [Acidobacteriota bacterium]